jgi:hypothetical protein
MEIGFALEIKAESGSALKSKCRSFKGSKSSNGGPLRLKMETWEGL